MVLLFEARAPFDLMFEGTVQNAPAKQLVCSSVHSPPFI